SKLGILKALLDTSIAGDDRPVAVPDRAEVAALFSEPDPHALLAGFAAFTTTINERTAGVYGVLVGAAATDPGAAALLAVVHPPRGARAPAARTAQARRRPTADAPRARPGEGTACRRPRARRRRHHSRADV